MRTCKGCSHPTICKTHGCGADEVRANKATAAGVPLRDYFAGQALTGILATPSSLSEIGGRVGNGMTIQDAHALLAYQHADAMLAARNASVATQAKEQ